MQLKKEPSLRANKRAYKLKNPANAGFFNVLTYCIGARGLRDPSSLRSVGMTALGGSGIDPSLRSG
jgi:hypothetical protein